MRWRRSMNEDDLSSRSNRGEDVARTTDEQHRSVKIDSLLAHAVAWGAPLDFCVRDDHPTD